MSPWTIACIIVGSALTSGGITFGMAAASAVTSCTSPAISIGSAPTSAVTIVGITETTAGIAPVSAFVSALIMAGSCADIDVIT